MGPPINKTRILKKKMR